MIHGEVHITLNYEDLDLPLTALVIDNNDCDILVGVPFCTQNDIIPLMRKKQVSIGGRIYHYGNSSKKPSVQDIYKVDSFLLRNESAKVVLPGDYFEYSSDALAKFNGEVVIEPHSEATSRVIQGTVRLQNDLDIPVPISTSQHLAVVRQITHMSEQQLAKKQDIECPPLQKSLKSNLYSNFSDSIVLNPDNYVSQTTVDSFKELHKCFDDVFNPSFGAYNDASGVIRAKFLLLLIKAKSPCTKILICSYFKKNLINWKLLVF